MRFENHCSPDTLPIMIVRVILVTPPSSPFISSREIRGARKRSVLIPIKKKCRGINHALAVLIRKKSREAPGVTNGAGSERPKERRAGDRRSSPFAFANMSLFIAASRAR